MALDTKSKRAAVAGVGRPWMRAQTPDSSLGRASRSSIGGTYPVADFGEPGELMLKLGTISPATCYVGSVEVSKMYLGATQVFG